MKHAGERLTALPTLLLEFRLGTKLGDVADAQIRDRRERRGDSQHRLQLFEVEYTDPSDAQRLGARREPEILNRAYGGVDIDGGVGLAAQSTALAAPVIAGDANVDRRIEYARQLQTVVEFPLLAFITFRCTAAGALEIPVHGLTDGRVANHYEIPGLHEADGRRMVRRVENTAEHLARHRLRQEFRADVTAFVDGAIDTPPFFL